MSNVETAVASPLKALADKIAGNGKAPYAGKEKNKGKGKAERLPVPPPRGVTSPAPKVVDTATAAALEDGIPAFLDRTKGKTPYQLKAEVVALATKGAAERKQQSSGRSIKNPPAKKAKEKVKRAGGKTIGSVATEAILAGDDNAAALAKVMKAFPDCSSNASCMSWYRNKLRKDGKLPKAAKTAKAPAKKAAAAATAKKASKKGKPAARKAKSKK